MSVTCKTKLTSGSCSRHNLIMNPLVVAFVCAQLSEKIFPIFMENSFTYYSKGLARSFESAVLVQLWFSSMSVLKVQTTPPQICIEGLTSLQVEHTCFQTLLL